MWRSPSAPTMGKVIVSKPIPHATVGFCPSAHIVYESLPNVCVRAWLNQNG